MRRLCAILLTFGAAIAMFGASQSTPTAAAGQPKKASDDLSKADQIRLTVLRKNLAAATTVAETRKATKDLADFFNEGVVAASNTQKYLDALTEGHTAMGSLEFDTAAKQYSIALRINPQSEEARQGLYMAVSGMQADKQNAENMRALGNLATEIQKLTKTVETKNKQPLVPAVPLKTEEKKQVSTEDFISAMKTQNDALIQALKSQNAELMKQNGVSMKANMDAIKTLQETVEKLQKSLDKNEVLNPPKKKPGQ